MEKELLERLAQLESHLTHLERQYDQLNQVVVEQGRQLKKLQTQQQKLADTMETAELERIQQTRAKPPHYQ